MTKGDQIEGSVTQIVGFTGTRDGMTSVQRDVVRKCLSDLIIKNHVIAIHGDCIGADADYDQIALELSIPRFCLPSNMPSYRAMTGASELEPPQDPLVRNRKIIDRSDLMIACPAQDSEIIRSGTWSTIRYARKSRKTIIVISPLSGILLK